MTTFAGVALILGVLYGIPAYLGACAIRALILTLARTLTGNPRRARTPRRGVGSLGAGALAARPLRATEA